MKRPAAAPGATTLDANALLRAHRGEFQRCYESSVVASLGRPGAEADALARLELTAAIAIAPSGHVETVSLNGDARPALKSCLSSAIGAIQFRRSDRGSELSFPLVFEPKVVPAKARTPTPSQAL